jgi:hypothetical protein
MYSHINVLVLLAVVVATPATATTVLEGSVGAQAFAELGTQLQSVVKSDSVVTLPDMISAASVAKVTSGPNSAQAETTVTAVWNSAESGTVEMTWGYDFAVQDWSLSGRAKTSATNWIYSFQAAGDGEFLFNYDVRLISGYPFGMRIVGFGGLPTIGRDWSPSETGVAVVPLVAGQIYSIGFGNYGDFGANTTIASRFHSKMSWEIVYSAFPHSVPEPATWAMVIAGFGMVGAAARRRRESQA